MILINKFIVSIVLTKLFIISASSSSGFSYKFPSLRFEILKPKGFQVSIPDEKGIKYFAFHGAINQFIQNPNAGQFYGVVSNAINNRWTYKNNDIVIHHDDIIYFWFHVQHNNQAFQILYRSYSIGKCVEEDINIPTITSSTTTAPTISTTTLYLIPNPTIEKLYPRGFRISIPSDPNIKIFAFHGSLNRRLHRYQPGMYNQVQTRPSENGRWFYENKFVDIDENEDSLNYWLHVQRGQAAFSTPVQIFSFKNLTASTPMIYTPTDEIIKSIDKCYNNEMDDDDSQIESELDFHPSVSTKRTNIVEDFHFITPLYNKVDTNLNDLNSQFLTSDEEICGETSTTVTDKFDKLCSGQLIFEDNFDDLNKNVWEEEIKISGLDDEFVMYRDDKENIYVQDGQLYIRPTLTVQTAYNRLRQFNLNLREKCTENENVEVWCERNTINQLPKILPPIVSAKVRTKKSFSFRYGRIEIRAKLPKGDWIFPQIFLEPLRKFYGNESYASGQMRVAYVRGNECLESKEGERIDGHRLYGGVVIDKNVNLRDVWMKTTSMENEHFSNDFHLYSLIWSNDKITLKVDDKQYGQIFGNFGKKAHKDKLKFANEWNIGNQMAPFDQDFYLSLGVGVGGNGDFPDGTRDCQQDDEKPWLNSHNDAELNFWNAKRKWRKTWIANNARLVIDYVRVYAL